ncbi:hypothetical protein ACFVR1_15530 [Psychrobacillus sp. NPDC058041]|uniref:hypothetical protein n=1 Tax=Psychrobacillus sp. NPDC058041 TaxID=3346310 RepID=UPI0036DAC6EE
MKKMILFLLGLIPFVLGFLMNSWLMQNQNSILPFKLIGIIFLVFWVLVGFITCKFEKTPLKSAVIINLPAFLILLFIMYQEIILGQYWFNIFGMATQFYYLPLLNISSSLVGIFLSLTPWATQIWSASLIAFLLMFASYYLGCYLKKRLSK